jgi:hypothetical protein
MCTAHHPLIIADILISDEATEGPEIEVPTVGRTGTVHPSGSKVSLWLHQKLCIISDQLAFAWAGRLPQALEVRNKLGDRSDYTVRTQSATPSKKPGSTKSVRRLPKIIEALHSSLQLVVGEHGRYSIALDDCNRYRLRRIRRATFHFQLCWQQWISHAYLLLLQVSSRRAAFDYFEC